MKLSSGLVGLLIVGSLDFTLALSFVVDYFAEAESAITAIERVDAMSRVPQESASETDPSIALDSSWPRSGKLEFRNVRMRYRPGLPLAPNGLSFEVPPGKTCGVVGRTGAVRACYYCSGSPLQSFSDCPLTYVVHSFVSDRARVHSLCSLISLGGN